MLIGHIDVLLLVDNIPVGVVAWHSYQAIGEIEKDEGAGGTYLNTQRRLMIVVDIGRCMQRLARCMVVPFALT